MLPEGRGAATGEKGTAALALGAVDDRDYEPSRDHVCDRPIGRAPCCVGLGKGSL